MTGTSFSQTPEAMRTKFNIDVRVANEVTAIDTRGKESLSPTKGGDRIH